MSAANLLEAGIVADNQTDPRADASWMRFVDQTSARASSR